MCVYVCVLGGGGGGGGSAVEGENPKVPAIVWNPAGKCS